jgi:hypothetical protein
MGRKMKMIHFPKTRFTELAARAGGIARDIAVEEALKSIEASRAESDAVIETSIAAIEAIVHAPGAQARLTEGQMREILRTADQIVTLAGLFRYPWLDTATRSLCDLTDGLLNKGLSDPAPVLVHVLALRMMAPGGTAPTPEEAEKVLGGLKRILEHFEFASLSASQEQNELDDAAYGIG